MRRDTRFIRVSDLVGKGALKCLFDRKRNKDLTDHSTESRLRLQSQEGDQRFPSSRHLGVSLRFLAQSYTKEFLPSPPRMIASRAHNGDQTHSIQSVSSLRIVQSYFTCLPSWRKLGTYTDLDSSSLHLTTAESPDLTVTLVSLNRNSQPTSPPKSSVLLAES